METGEISSYRDLDVWRNGMEFATDVNRLTKLMPKTEEYRLTSQVLRAAASVPANIAEGHTPRRQRGALRRRLSASPQT
jgi:four helix bundle protein